MTLHAFKALKTPLRASKRDCGAFPLAPMRVPADGASLSRQIARAVLIGGLLNLVSCATAAVYWGPF